MLMNRLETWMMVNPIREGLQRHIAGPTLARLGGTLQGGRALEIGCGHGEGVRIILEDFGAARVDAFDLDPALVARAHKKLLPYASQVRVWAGDVLAIDAPDGLYDAVFGFGVLHHLPDWRAGLDEVVRVLKPGGRFYSEESYAAFITHPFWRRVMDHPQHDRFSPAQYAQAMREAGLEVLGEEVMRGDGLGWIVARKPEGHGSTASDDASA